MKQLLSTYSPLLSGMCDVNLTERQDSNIAFTDSKTDSPWSTIFFQVVGPFIFLLSEC